MKANVTRQVIAWPGMAVLAVVNGVLRDLVYGRGLSGDAAHAVSTLPLLGLLLGYFALLQRWWPLRSRREALTVSGAWLALTLLFEFGFGRLEGKSWGELFRDYNLLRGRTWLLVPLAIAVLPEWIRQFREGRGEPGPAAEGLPQGGARG